MCAVCFGQLHGSVVWALWEMGALTGTGTIDMTALKCASCLKAEATDKSWLGRCLYAGRNERERVTDLGEPTIRVHGPAQNRFYGGGGRLLLRHPR